jgi:hypothetical protein
MRRLKQFLIALALAVSACAEEGPTNILPGPPPPEIPPPTSPENLVRAIDVIFNDKVRDASERLREYKNLFDPEFVFHCQTVDGDSCRICPCRYFTIDGAEALFAAQDSGGIYELRLDLSFKPAIDLDPPQPGREEWKMVFVSNVDFQLLVTPQDGWRVTGGQAEILAYPSADRRRWFIGEWFSLPRP